MSSPVARRPLMFRKVMLLTVVAVAAQQAPALAQDSWSVWYTGCPLKWTRYNAVNTKPEADRIATALKAAYPALHFGVVANYNGSRNPPTTNPCGGGGG